jgi:hypothetical protein
MKELLIIIVEIRGYAINEKLTTLQFWSGNAKLVIRYGATTLTLAIKMGQSINNTQHSVVLC